MSGVPVADTASVTIVSTGTSRITLPVSATKNVSGTVLLNPASTTEVAYVTAKQTFSSGPTVRVATKAADASSGSYLLTLPADAPLLGQYGLGTLPIVFTGQAAVAGKYLLEASAAGYKTQQVSKDVSTGATQDFTLVP